MAIRRALEWIEMFEVRAGCFNVKYQTCFEYLWIWFCCLWLWIGRGEILLGVSELSFCGILLQPCSRCGYILSPCLLPLKAVEILCISVTSWSLFDILPLSILPYISLWLSIMGDELINSIWTTFQDGVWFKDVWLHTGYQALALFPGLHTQLLSLAVRNAGGRPGRTYHVMRATADVTFSLLASGFVLSPSLFFPWIQFVLSVQFVLWVRLLLDRSWLATVRDVSSGMHHVISPSRPSPRFSYCKWQKLGMEAWERG